MADAPKIVVGENGDTLRTAYPKINSAIDNANEALNKSNNATSTANAANTTANQAKTEAENVQTQLNTIVATGDSGPEAAQARVDEEGNTFATLQARLNNSDKRLSDKQKQTYLLGEFFRKIRQDEAVTIKCLGDSLTYGQDTVSADKRVPDPTPTGNGSTHTQTRASVTYPEALKTYLDMVYPAGNITVLNQGYSGDSTLVAYNRWPNNVGSNLTFIMLGTNDSSDTAYYKQLLEDYIKNYRKLIERELRWNCAVVLLTPPKTLLGNLNRQDSYANAVHELGLEYGCPVVDMSEMTANLSADNYCDSIHFNGKGYNYMGARIASLLIGNGVINPMYVAGYSFLGTRNEVDSVNLQGALRVVATGYPTPDESTIGSGVAHKITKANKIFYSFYTSEDDMIVVPALFHSYTDVTLRAKLDFGLETQASNNTFNFYNNAVATTNRHMPGSIDITKSDSNMSPAGVFGLKGIKKTSDKYLFIPKKGWHTVCIEVLDEPNNREVTIYGIEFASYRDVYVRENIRPFIYTKATHTVYNDGTDVISMGITFSDVVNALKMDDFGSSYWSTKPLKITVFSYDSDIVEYYLQVGGSNAVNQDKWRISSAKETNMLAGQTTKRTISSIAYNATTGVLTLNFAGTTTRASVIMISYVA